MSDGRGTGRAVVIGGSIAGLCAGRVLAGHFERVTVLDRDRFPAGAQHRKGVPQSRHPHAMLDSGRRELERLFPGFEALAVERGAIVLNPGLEMATLRQNGWSRRREAPFTLLFASRVLFESVIRELAAKIPNLEVVENAEVTDLLVSEDRRRVIGVRTRDGEIDADLVVDASGRETRAPGWLEKLGLPPIETEVVDADAGYSSRWYQGPSGADRPEGWWWKCLWIEPVVAGAEVDETEVAEAQYFGVLFPVENDRWVITTASWGGRELAKDPENFERMISRLRTPIIAEAIAKAEPISPVYFRRSMQNTWRHYERWKGAVAGFVATGDAACAFNPVYGQGMSSASKSVGVLERCLADDDPRDPGFPARFFARQAEFLGVPWMMATSRDRQQARLEGDDPGAQRRLQLFARRLAGYYMQNVALAAPADPEINTRLFDVVNLSRPPSELFEPRIFARVLLRRLQQTLRPEKVRESDIPDHPPAEIVD